MKKIMKQNVLFALGLMTALSLSGCQSKQTDTESEALRQQIPQLEQQIQNLNSRSAPTARALPKTIRHPLRHRQKTMPLRKLRRQMRLRQIRRLLLLPTP